MADYLITGVSGGMGAALARALLKEGHRVFGLDRTEQGPEGCVFLRTDVTDSAEVRAAAETVARETGGLDGIIHTAGIYDLNSLLEMPEEDFLRDFNVNLFGMFRVNQSFAPLLRKGGRIVMVSSELAPLHPLPFTGVYAVTKGAVEKYAEALRMEAQLLDRKVIVVRPGAVRTAMLPASTEKLDKFVSGTALYKVNAARFKRIVDRVEARSVPPERVASVIQKALFSKRPRLTYKVNRNPLLILLNALPKRMQLFLIRAILK